MRKLLLITLLILISSFANSQNLISEDYKTDSTTLRIKQELDCEDTLYASAISSIYNSFVCATLNKRQTKVLLNHIQVVDKLSSWNRNGNMSNVVYEVLLEKENKSFELKLKKAK